MKTFSITMILGILLASSMSFARSCKDEPERCPILKMVCVSSDKLLRASVYDSLFIGEIIRVNESICAQSSCHTKTVAGSFEIYPSGLNYTLIDKVTGKTALLQCSTVNRGNL